MINEYDKSHVWDAADPGVANELWIEERQKPFRLI